MAAGAVAVLLTPGVASAHAVLVGGTPAAGATVAPGHLVIDLRFNSRIEHKASQLRMQGPQGAPTPLPLLDSPANVLHAETELTPGAYTLHWQVLALDGHITRGLVPFTVGSAGAPAGPGPVAK